MSSLFNRRDEPDRPAVLVTFGFPTARMTYYRAVITREFPEWKATVTGGGIRESGQVLTSLSYARLEEDVHDWVEWNEWGELNGWCRELAPDDDQDEDQYDQDELDSGAGSGVGWTVTYDGRWPQDVQDALERYWAARKTLDWTTAMSEATSVELGELLYTIHDGLQAGDADVAAIVGLPVNEARQIMSVYSSRKDFLEAGLTLEYWRAWREEQAQRRTDS